MSVEYFLSEEAAHKWADENTDDLGRPLVKKYNFTDESTKVFFRVIKATRTKGGRKKKQSIDHQIMAAVQASEVRIGKHLKHLEERIEALEESS